MDNITNFNFGNIDTENFAIRIVDVHSHLAVIDHLFGIGGDIDGDGIAIRFDDFELDGFGGGIGQHVIEAETPVATLAFFGEHLGESFILAFASAVGAINAHHLLLDSGLVAIGILFGGDLGGVSQNFFGIEKVPFGTGVVAGGDDRRGPNGECHCDAE